MKKSRLLSVLLCLALLSGLLTTFASAADSGSAILDEMDVNAKAAVLVDPDTGEILYEKNAHAHNYPRLHHQGDDLPAHPGGGGPGRAVPGADRHRQLRPSHRHRGGRFHGRYQRGEQIRIIDLLYAALIPRPTRRATSWLRR